MDPSLPLLGVFGGTAAIVAAVAWQIRIQRADASPPRTPPVDRIAFDPFAQMWSELDWLVIGGPDVVNAIEELGTVLEEEARHEAELRALEESIDRLAYGSATLATWEVANPFARATATNGPPPRDPLRVYLERFGG